MHFLSGIDEKNRLSHMGQFAYYNQQDTFDEQKRILDNYLSDMIGKTGVFLPGGIGRLANYARSKGVDAHCLDISKICEELCKKYYPDVPFIRADMSFEKEGFDFAFLEDLLWSGFNIASLKVAVNWQKVTTIYPKKVSYKVIRFNSNIYETIFSAPEADLDKYIKNQLNHGLIKAYFDLEELDNFEIEEHTIETNSHIGLIEHLPNSKYKFLGIGNINTVTTNNFSYCSKLYCAGFKLNLQTNSRHLLNNIPSEMKSITF